MANIKAQAADDPIKAAIDAAIEANKERRDEAVAKNKRHRAAINSSIIEAADDPIKAAIDAAIEANKERRDEVLAKNKRHRAAINRSIIADILALLVDIDEETAKKIVVSVADGAIPGMRIDY